MMRMPVVAVALSLAALSPGLHAQEASRPSSDHEAPPSHWLALTPDEREAVERFASEYKAFMSEAKTELSFVTEALELAREAGFAELTEDSKLTPGARFYDVNRDRAVALIIADLSPHVDEQLRERTAMEVIDFGIPILSIHTPYSVSSKLDVYNLYRAMKAFCLR
jgi:aspartyl aminopeptidase